jgi:hypothetical protein
MDTRFRLKFSAKANDYATGVIYFEGDSTRWGEVAGAGAQRNQAGQWNADRAAVELKQFYIDFKIPGLSDFAPTTLRAGVQGFALRSHALLFADGAGVELNSTTGPVKHSWYWYKPAEGNDWNADDTDVYGVRVWVPDMLPVTPGAYIMYWNSNNYPIRSALPATNNSNADLFWIGGYVDGKIGPVAIKSDLIYSGGDIEARGGNPVQQDTDIGGFMGFIDACASIPMGEMAIDVGGTFMYATGNDVRDATRAAPADLDFDAFLVPPGSEEPYIGDWSIVFYASRVNDGVRISNLASGTAAALGKAGGTWFGKLYAGVKPLDWMKIKLYAMYIGDTTDRGNTIGNAASTVNAAGPVTFSDDSDIGIEVGAYVDFNIYKNLTYSIGAGYLFAGDALDTFDPAGTIISFPVPTNTEPDDPWAVVSQLIFKF